MDEYSEVGIPKRVENVPNEKKSVMHFTNLKKKQQPKINVMIMNYL